MQRILWGIAAAIAAGSAVAALPYTFTPNTPAKAAEVNANFSQLDQRITAIEARPQAGDGDNDTDDDTPPLFHDANITYTPVSTTPGQRITLQGIEHILVRVPVADLISKRHYAVTVPISQHPSGNYTYVYPPNLQINHCEYFRGALLHSASGIEVRIELNEQISTSTGTLVDGDQNLRIASVDHNYYVYANLQIKLGEHTCVNVHLNSPSSGSIKTADVATPDANFDYVGNANWTALEQDNFDVRPLDQLVDYIRVEALP